VTSIPDPSWGRVNQEHPICPVRPTLLRRLAIAWAAPLALLAAGPGAARAQETNQPAPEIGMPAEERPWLPDRVHRALSWTVGYSTGWLDHFITPDPSDLDEPGSFVKVTPKLQLEDTEGLTYGCSFSTKLALPHLQRRIELLADNVPAALLPNEELPAKADDVSAAMRLNVWRERLSWVGLDGGLKFIPEPAPFGRLTLTLDVPLRRWAASLNQQMFWYFHDDGYGEMTELNLFRVLGRRCLFKSTTAARWSEITDGVEWGQTLLVGKVLTPCESELVFRGSVFGHKSGAGVIDKYVVNATYRRRLFRPWLYGSLTPQVRFPAERDWTPTPLVLAALELYFGDFRNVSISIQDF
jgi:hypothetical protein